MRISDWSSDVCSSDLGQPLPAPGDVAGQFGPLRPREAEQDCPGIAFQNRRDIRQVDTIVTPVEIAGRRQLIQEPPQAKPLDIRPGTALNGRHCWRLPTL